MKHPKVFFADEKIILINDDILTTDAIHLYELAKSQGDVEMMRFLPRDIRNV